MEILNYTPHTVNAYLPDGSELPFEPHGRPPRLQTDRRYLGEIEGIPFVERTMGDPEGLPYESDDIIYIVSKLVADAVTDRSDLAYPGEVIRDKHGNVIGCKGLCAGPGLADRLDKHEIGV